MNRMLPALLLCFAVLVLPGRASAQTRPDSAAVLLDGGLAAGSLRPEITPAGYAPRVRIPILMVNGSYDATYQLESSQKPLFALLGSSAENKLHVRYPTGHAVFTLYRNQAIHNILDWLDRYLGPTS